MKLQDSLKILNTGNIQMFTMFFKNIYNTGQIPKDWLLSTFDTLPKRPVMNFVK